MISNKNIPANAQIAVGLDIGTTKICAVVGYRNEAGKLEILSMGRTESLIDAVVRGEVANIAKTTQGIATAVKIAADALIPKGIILNDIEVIVGIAGAHIRSKQSSSVALRPDADVLITKEEVEALRQEMFKLSVNPGEKIIGVLPQEHTVDNLFDIDPIGVTGTTLEANYHVIIGKEQSIKNINRCVESAGFRCGYIELEPLASAMSVLTDEQREAGVVLIDIGGGTTDVAIFHKNMIRHSAVIPYAGNVITKDLETVLNITRSNAEQVKLKCGHAVPSLVKENSVVSIPGIGNMPAKQILAVNISKIIKSRLEDIFKEVQEQMEYCGLEEPAAGIVITGGGSLLLNIKEMAEVYFGQNVSLGKPTAHLADSDENNEIFSPMYSTVVGLLMNGLNLYENDKSITSNQPEAETVMSTRVKDTTTLLDPQKKPKGFGISIYNTMVDIFKEKNID